VPTWPVDHFQSKLATPINEFTLKTPHRGVIHAIHLKVPKSKGLIFYLHGNTGSLRRWQFMAEELTTYGFDVVAMDFRKYGLSHGPQRESWMHKDAEMMFDHVCEDYATLPVVIYGRSLGTGFATRLAARRRVSGLVLETPFSNMADVARFYLPMLPVKWLLRYRFRSDFFLQKVECPVLILHGTKDMVVPYRLALKLFQAAEGKAEVQMTTIVGGKHGNLSGYPLFREKLAAFFDSVFIFKGT